MSENNSTHMFTKGEFITNTNKPGSFAIFEGIECESYGNTRKYSAIAYYDPNRYMESPDGSGWGYQPFIEVATAKTRCTQTVDGGETYWWKSCSAEEIEEAFGVLHDYGYYWNEDLNSIIDRKTGEIIRTVSEPIIKYNGDVVKPISKKFKDLLKYVCDKITEKKYSYQYQGAYRSMYDFWDGECWD